MSPLARLALAYAPAHARGAWLTFLELDARLAGVVRTAREPILAQLRLAWWRDRFAADPASWPRGEPLLTRLALWSEVSVLGALVDGWEAMLGEPPLSKGALTDFANGRSRALGALAFQLGADVVSSEAAARRWALADLALHIGNPDEKLLAKGLLSQSDPGGRIARVMRPLAVLAGLSERAVRLDRPEALSGPGALFAAIRLGIAGR